MGDSEIKVTKIHVQHIYSVGYTILDNNRYFYVGSIVWCQTQFRTTWKWWRHRGGRLARRSWRSFRIVHTVQDHGKPSLGDHHILLFPSKPCISCCMLQQVAYIVGVVLMYFFSKCWRTSQVSSPTPSSSTRSSARTATPTQTSCSLVCSPPACSWSASEPSCRCRSAFVCQPCKEGRLPSSVPSWRTCPSRRTSVPVLMTSCLVTVVFKMATVVLVTAARSRWTASSPGSPTFKW